MSRRDLYTTEHIDTVGEYPGFSKFTAFICKEGHIVCNPISSVLAVIYSEGETIGETKCSMADTLITNMHKTATTESFKGHEPPPCPKFKRI